MIYQYISSRIECSIWLIAVIASFPCFNNSGSDIQIDPCQLFILHSWQLQLHSGSSSSQFPDLEFGLQFDGWSIKERLQETSILVVLARTLQTIICHFSCNGRRKIVFIVKYYRPGAVSHSSTHLQKETFSFPLTVLNYKAPYFIFDNFFVSCHKIMQSFIWQENDLMNRTPCKNQEIRIYWPRYIFPDMKHEEEIRAQVSKAMMESSIIEQRE